MAILELTFETLAIAMLGSRVVKALLVNSL